MADTYLDSINGARKKLRSCATRIDQLGQSFYNTGNDVMHNKLSDIADKIIEAEEVIGKTVSGEISRQFKQAQQSTANMAKTCLAVSELKKEV